jgi:hypothetical protein
MKQFLTVETVMVPLEGVHEHPRNPNVGDDVSVGQSIAELGFWGALVVQRSSGHILVGNTRYRALRKMGYTHAPVLYADVDDRTAHRIMLADNRLATFATSDAERLNLLLTELAGEGLLLGTGYSDLDLRHVVEAQDATELPDTDAGMAEEPDLERLIILLPKAGYDQVTDWLGRHMAALSASGYGEVLLHLMTRVPAPEGPLGPPPERRTRSRKTERAAP